MAKRKRKALGTTSEDVTPKRARPQSDDGSENEEGDDAHETTLAEIHRLESSILESKKNYNNIAALISILDDADDRPDEAYNSTVALTRVFLNLLAGGQLTRRSGQSEKDVVVLEWLRERLSEFKAALFALLRRDDDFSVTALTICMKILKAEALHLSEKVDYMFPHTFFSEMVRGVFAAGTDETREAFVDKFVGQFVDLRFYTFKAIKDILSDQTAEASNEDLFDDALGLLSVIQGIPETTDDLVAFFIPAPKKKSHPLHLPYQHKKAAQDAWLALMRLASTKSQRKQILDILSSAIAPWFVKPELLADFLTDCYDAGGSVSHLALSGIFFLIQERNLDYPSFYAKLYSLFDADMLHSKHRSRVFRLLDVFLASTHLPAVLVASFLKRLSRLALHAPPSAIVFVVPWIYNLLKRHPLCTFMIHRETRDEKLRALMDAEGLGDPFDPEEADPMQTGAMESCLWEIVQLQSHYHPNVATIAKIISEQFTKQSYNMEDFLDHSYSSLLDAELGKEVKKTPVVEFHIPKRILLPHDAEAGAEDSLLVKLWDFDR